MSRFLIFHLPANTSSVEITETAGHKKMIVANSRSDPHEELEQVADVFLGKHEAFVLPTSYEKYLHLIKYYVLYIDVLENFDICT